MKSDPNIPIRYLARRKGDAAKLGVDRDPARVRPVMPAGQIGGDDPFYGNRSPGFEAFHPVFDPDFYALGSTVIVGGVFLERVPSDGNRQVQLPGEVIRLYFGRRGRI